MAAADVVRSWHGAPEFDITPELGKWESFKGGLQTKNAPNFSCAERSNTQRWDNLMDFEIVRIGQKEVVSAMAPRP